MDRPLTPRDVIVTAPKPEGYNALSEEEIRAMYAEQHADLPPLGQVTPVDTTVR